MDEAEFQQMEDDLGDALWGRMGKIEGKKALAAYRAEVERQTRIKCAEEIEKRYHNSMVCACGSAVCADPNTKRWEGDEPEYGYGYNAATWDAIDLIHPDKEN